MNLIYFDNVPSSYISFANTKNDDYIFPVWYILDKNSNWFKSWLVIKL